MPGGGGPRSIGLGKNCDALTAAVACGGSHAFAADRGVGIPAEEGGETSLLMVSEGSRGTPLTSEKAWKGETIRCHSFLYF